MKKRTEITIETERFLVVSQRRAGTILWCQHCGKNVPMLTVDEVATTCSSAEANQLHFVRTPEGRLLVCSNSLALARARQNAL